MMAELHLERARTGGECEQLMPETNAEHRQAGLQNRTNRRNRVGAGLGIPRPVGEEHAVRPHRHHVRRQRLRRHHCHPAAAVNQHTQDIALDAEIVGHHVKPGGRCPAKTGPKFPTAFLPGIGLFGADTLGEIHAAQPRERARARQRRFLINLAAFAGRDDAAVLGAFFPQQARQPAGVDAGDADHFMLFHKVLQGFRGAPVAHHGR